MRLTNHHSKAWTVPLRETENARKEIWKIYNNGNRFCKSNETIYYFFVYWIGWPCRKKSGSEKFTAGYVRCENWSEVPGPVGSICLAQASFNWMLRFWFWRVPGVSKTYLFQSPSTALAAAFTSGTPPRLTHIYMLFAGLEVRILGNYFLRSQIYDNDDKYIYTKPNCITYCQKQT